MYLKKYSNELYIESVGTVEPTSALRSFEDTLPGGNIYKAGISFNTTNLIVNVSPFIENLHYFRSNCLCYAYYILN